MATAAAEAASVLMRGTIVDHTTLPKLSYLILTAKAVLIVVKC